MPTLDWYQRQLESITKFTTEHIHPGYGPCDGLRDGQCSECLRVLGVLKTGTARFNSIKLQLEQFIKEIEKREADVSLCTLADHTQGMCECEELAAHLRAILGS